MRMALLGVLAVACSCNLGPPIKTAAGEVIERVSFEESFPLTKDTNEFTLHGDKLRRGVELMDKHHVVDMKGDYKASGVLDKSTLTMTVKPVNGVERRATFRSCADASLCSFFEEAAASGVVERKPLVCRNAIPCEKPR